jgi:pyrimidine-nucleoside phosphorylase
LSESLRVLKKCRAVLIGQTKEIAPADKLIYSLRDVTATVESIPLITASIMSKKLAEGIDGLVLDIKTGNGAFMKSLHDSVQLSDSLIQTAKSFNKKIISFITDMNQPLGNYIGNWLEIVESINVLKGEVKNDLYKLSVKLAGAMIYLCKKANSLPEGEILAKEKINNGEAFKKFLEIVKMQGGNTKFILNPEHYPKSRYIKKLLSIKSGYLEGMNTYQIGMASLELGAGRKTKSDAIVYNAGIILFNKIGNFVNKGEAICELHSDSKNKIHLAEEMIFDSIHFSKIKPLIPKLIKKIIR